MATRKQAVSGDADGLFRLALEAHQISSTVDPSRSIRSLLKRDEGTTRPVPRKGQPRGFIARPYLIWKENLDLARELNDGLAERLN